MLRNYITLPRTVHVLCLGTLINRAGSFLVPFLTTYLDGHLGLGAQFATTAVACWAAGALAAALVGGHLADLIGRRTVMLMSLVGNASILLFFGSLTQRWQILTAVLAFALLADMYRPAASAMIADVVDAARRPYAFGLRYLAINLGFAIAPVVAGRLSKISFQFLFWADAATSITYALIIAFAVRETLARRSDGSPREPGATLGETWSHILHDGVFLRFCAAQFFVSAVYMQSLSTFPLFLKGLGIDAAMYGQIIAINGAMIVLFQIPITHSVTGRRRSTVIVLAAIVTAVGFGLKSVAVMPWQFALTVVVWTLGEMMQSSLLPAITGDLAPPNMRARYFGLLSMTFSGSAMLAVPVGGWVLSNFGGRALWFGTAGTAMLAAFLFSSIRRRIEHSAGGRAASVVQEPAVGISHLAEKAENALDESPDETKSAGRV